jgi:hypothetical protein
MKANRNNDSGRHELELGVLAVRAVLEGEQKPVAGALVTVWSQGGAAMSAVSDGDGLAHFGLQFPGEYRVEVRKPRLLAVRGEFRLQLGRERVARVVLRRSQSQMN